MPLHGAFALRGDHSRLSGDPRGGFNVRFTVHAACARHSVGGHWPHGVHGGVGSKARILVRLRPAENQRLWLRRRLFNKKLTELSKGTLSINQYPGAQLGTEAQTLQKVQTGDIDFVMLSTANASTIQPESGVFSIHFIFRDEGTPSRCSATPR